MWAITGKPRRSFTATWQGIKQQKPFALLNTSQDRVTFCSSAPPQFDIALSEKHREAIRATFLDANREEQDWPDFAYKLSQMITLFFSDATRTALKDSLNTPWPTIQEKLKNEPFRDLTKLNETELQGVDRSELQVWHLKVTLSAFAEAVQNFLREKGKDPSKLTGLDVIKLLKQETYDYLDAKEGPYSSKNLRNDFYRSLDVDPEDGWLDWKSLAPALSKWYVAPLQEMKQLSHRRELSWTDLKQYLLDKRYGKPVLKEPEAFIEVAERLFHKYGKNPNQASCQDFMGLLKNEVELEEKRDYFKLPD